MLPVQHGRTSWKMFSFKSYSPSIGCGVLTGVPCVIYLVVCTLYFKIKKNCQHTVFVFFDYV